MRAMQAEKKGPHPPHEPSKGFNFNKERLHWHIPEGGL
jgi:hypothetical protein